MRAFIVLYFTNSEPSTKRDRKHTPHVYRVLSENPCLHAVQLDDLIQTVSLVSSQEGSANRDVIHRCDTYAMAISPTTALNDRR